MSFGERLKTARKAAGLSQTELAAGRYSLSYVSHLEAGRRAPTPELATYFERRLGLEEGALSAGEIPLSRSRTTAADVTALFLSAQNEWREGAMGRALEQAQQAIKQAEEIGQNELRWMALELLTNVETDLGRYDDAADHAVELTNRTERMRSTELTVRAHLLASRTTRIADRPNSSADHAQRALIATQGLPKGHRLRVLALANAVSADPKDRTHLAELASSVESLEHGHTAGIGAWVLGNVCLRSGKLKEGLKWYAITQRSLSPSTDFRNWARFPRASADERLWAGITDGVPELLERARLTLPLLDNPDEVALLARTEGDYYLAIDNPQKAITTVEAVLSDEDIPPGSRGELHMIKARAHRALDDEDQAKSEAMKAAQVFTEDDMLAHAKYAWAFLSGTDEKHPSA